MLQNRHILNAMHNNKRFPCLLRFVHLHDDKLYFQIDETPYGALANKFVKA